MRLIAVKHCNALHAGHRPPRNFEPGQLVYFWRKGTDRPKKDSYIYWKGPARVVLTAPPSTVWINYKGYVVKAAPEHLRHATEEERFTLSSWIDDISDTRRQLNQEPRRGYLDLTKEPCGRCDNSNRACSRGTTTKVQTT